MNIPLGNSVYNANFSEQNVKEKIDTIISQANRIKIPFLWWVGVLSKPHNLGEYLVEAGLIKHETTGMYLNLSKLDEKQYHKAVDQSKITISRVSNPKEEEEWIDVCAVAFEVDESKDEISYIWRTFFKHSDAYLATYEGKPVGISLVLYSSGVAGIYCVGVCPEFRNRGIGKAITMAPLLQAKKKGYEISILMSSELGFNVYSQIGYKECCKYGLYTYTPGNENEGK
jgi:GNAT superfamily N-acetyltransferase